jgi:hypothetical protein
VYWNLLTNGVSCSCKKLMWISKKMKLEELKLGKKREPSFLPIAIFAVVFPLSILFWVVNHFFIYLTTPIGEWGSDSAHLTAGIFNLFITYNYHLHWLHFGRYSSKKALLDESTQFTWMTNIHSCLLYVCLNQYFVCCPI